MKLGIMAANTGRYAYPTGAAELASAAEAAGVESLWTAEHVLWPDSYGSTYPYDDSGEMPGGRETPLPDPLIWLSWVAAKTTSIRLATGILIVPQRQPAILAKEVATLDVLSGGRMLLGIGVGWLEEEFAALGVPFAARGRRTDEYLVCLQALWSGDSVDFDGEFVSFSGMSSNPKPVSGTVPIVVGGHSRRSAERAGRIGDGFAPLGGDIPELVDIMRQTAAEHGRDPESIEVTTTHEGLYGEDPLAAVEEMTGWGADRLLIQSFRLGRGDLTDRCAHWVERLRP